jgi:transcriptional regulator with XRE-family HTH domain
MPTMVHIGDNLKRLRILSTLTQAELAQKAGVTPTAVARIERNETEPRTRTIRKLSNALEVEPKELLEGAL